MAAPKPLGSTSSNLTTHWRLDTGDGETLSSPGYRATPLMQVLNVAAYPQASEYHFWALPRTGVGEGDQAYSVWGSGDIAITMYLLYVTVG